jgi:signal transduction histidine kinase
MVRTGRENGTIADSGRTIPHDVRERIFDPFLTTATAGR